MFRCLAPAGHGIALNRIFRSFFQEPDDILEKLIFPQAGCFPVSSGTAALYLSLMAARKDSSRTRVILPAYSCPSLLAAVVRAGLEPVLCDLKEDSFQLDTAKLGSIVNDNTLAVIAVHLFGLPEDISQIRSVLGNGQVLLIEDAAQAFGNTLILRDASIDPGGEGRNDQVRMGCVGDIGILSFGRGKPLSSLEGGAVLVNNPDLLSNMRAEYDPLDGSYSVISRGGYLARLLIYSFFFRPFLYWIPANMPGLGLGETRFSPDFLLKKARTGMLSMAGVMMEHFEKIRKARLNLARAYLQALAPFGNDLAFIPGQGDGQGDIALLRFPVIFRDRQRRDLVLKKLKSQGLGATGMYPAPLNEIPGTSQYLDPGETFPQARSLSQRILTLPVHEYVTRQDIQRIARVFSHS